MIANKILFRSAALNVSLFCLSFILTISSGWAAQSQYQPHTSVSIKGDQWYINDKPTYAGRTWKDKKIEGLLMNSRMVQGVFDDMNPETVSRWAYPDTGKWDAERNTREFLAAMPSWRAHGLLAFTLCLQGGSPEGYSKTQPWHNSAFKADGSLYPEYAARAERIIKFADDLGMVVILSYFYYRQDHRLVNEKAVLRAVDKTTQWILKNNWRNVVIEINNETNDLFHHPILRPDRVHELVERVGKIKSSDARRLLVSTSYVGGKLPSEKVLQVSDYVLLHGNKVHDPARITEMVQQVRAMPNYTPRPIVFNEDDHFNFEVPVNNFTSAVSEYASWGYFDYRMTGEGYHDGFQSIPVDWMINSPRKKGFFRLLAEITDMKP